MNLFKYHPKLFGKREVILSTPWLAFQIAHDHNGYDGPRPLALRNEIEEFLARDPFWAREYAEYVVQGRFKKGEPAIATDGDESYNYARFVLLDRFKKGEPAIKARSDVLWSQYARRFDVDD